MAETKIQEKWCGCEETVAGLSYALDEIIEVTHFVARIELDHHL